MKFIDNLSSSTQKETAHQLNRRSEVTVFSSKADPIFGGAIDLMLMDINNKLVLSDRTYSFIGLEDELEDQLAESGDEDLGDTESGDEDLGGTDDGVLF